MLVSFSSVSISSPWFFSLLHFSTLSFSLCLMMKLLAFHKGLAESFSHTACNHIPPAHLLWFEEGHVTGYYTGWAVNNAPKI